MLFLVPTDFSPAATAASRFAAQLAARAGASLHLLHFYQLPIGYGETPTLPLDTGFLATNSFMVPVEEMQASAQAGLDEALSKLAGEFPGLSIQGAARIGGDIASDINDYGRELAPDLVIMGSHKMQGIDHLVGSTTLSLVKHLKFPVIAVPHLVTTTVNTIMLAADGEEMPAASGAALVRIATALHCSLQVVHVATDAGSAPAPLPSLESLSPSYRVVVNEDVTAGLEEALLGEPTAMLAILPHHHSLWEKLFFHLHTKDLLTNLHVPVLCLPEER